MPTLEVVVDVRKYIIRDENEQPIGEEIQVKKQEITVDSVGSVSSWTTIPEE